MRVFYHCRFRTAAMLLLGGWFLFLQTSCNTSKHTTYFQDMLRDTTLANLVRHPLETTIVPGDLLSITVASLSPENTALYNVAPDGVDGLKGYMVDKNGDISFIKLGKVQAAGLTKVALSNQLQKDLEPYLSQNVVTVDIQNRHVTMMGAVSSKVLPLTDKMTLLDALASSGDIGNKGKSDNILLIREADSTGSQKTFQRLNLTDHSIFYSPYFYLKPNDIVYVEPAQPKMTAVSVISLVVSTTSFIFLLIDRIFR